LAIDINHQSAPWGLLSSDGGVLALREVEERLGVADRAGRAASKGAALGELDLGGRHRQEARLEEEAPSGCGIRQIGRVRRAGEGEGVTLGPVPDEWL
jgi:hypothetical protein